MAAQQGTGQTVWQSHYDVFHPGMIASQYPHSIKSALFRASDRNSTNEQILKFGTACGRYGADTMLPNTPDNFDGRTGGTESSPTYGKARYAAGGGAYVTDTISYEAIPAGLVKHASGTLLTAANLDSSPSATTMKVAGDHYHEIVVGDYIRIVAAGNSPTVKEIMRVTNITPSTGFVTLGVIRSQHSNETNGSTAIDEDDIVQIYARSHTFAGVALKDITIEGRWVPKEKDSFINGDEVPVGIKGDFAVLLDFDSQSDAVTGGVAPDRPVSVRLNNSTGTAGSNIYRPYTGTNSRNKNLFASDNFQDANTIIVKGARYVTGPYEATLHPQGTRGPGSDGPQTVVVASVRFASNV